MRRIRVGLAQINCTVGAYAANVAKIEEYIARAAREGVDLLAFPELAVCGYPPEDLLFESRFISDAGSALAQIARAGREFPEMTVVVGCLERRGARLYNSAAVLKAGSKLHIYHKHHLPNYGVFDEKRYFTSGRDNLVLEVAGVSVGVSICEDIWHKAGPPDKEVASGAEIIVNLNASPYQIGKPEARREYLSKWARRHACAVVYVNLVGGQDELVFDGHSLVFDAAGRPKATARQFSEDLLVTDIDADEVRDYRDGTGTLGPPGRASQEIRAVLPRLDEVLAALQLGIADYVSKNRFSRVVLGLSGGIDSALTAALAVEALGKENVTPVFLPSRYTSAVSLEDAAALAENLGLEMPTIPIEPVLQAYLASLSDILDTDHPDLTEENLQARIRGNILMAFSNKYGWLLLSTGNKSEMSVGYTTLYGDMSGGFAVLKDVSKTLVYDLARRLNERRGREMIPARTITRAPSAELAPDQKDSDTLPEYSVLDPILSAYIEDEKSVKDIVAEGFPAGLVERIAAMVDRSEYKRRQAPPGVKITSRAFGKDRRVPITNWYRPTEKGAP